MDPFKTMSDEELHRSAIRAARLDREAQLVTLAHLMEVESRRLFSKLGFSTMFSYAVQGLGFSEPAAGQRVQAMRLAQSIPLAYRKCKSSYLHVFNII